MTNVLAYLFAAVVIGQSGAPLDLRTLIEQALNEPGGIAIENETLADTIKLVAEQTGVKLVMGPEAMNLMPLGPRTLIQKVKIANMPLRDGLTRLFAPLGMTLVVRDDHVEIVPRDGLRGLNRPATWEELDTLSELAAIEPGIDSDALESLRSRIQFQVAVRGAWQVLAQAIRDVGAGSGDDVLTVACGNLAWAWSLAGRRIIITGMVQAIRQRLQQPIAMRITNRPLLDVMHAVGDRIGVTIRLEPGLLASLPIHLRRNFSIDVHRDSAEQVLDTIASYMGLGYLIEPEGVLFYGPATRGASGTADPREPPGTNIANAQAPSVDPYVAKMVVQLEEGQAVEWLIRRSELPEDLRLMRQRNLAELFEAARRSAPGSHP